MGSKISIGDKVEHILTKDWFIVLGFTTSGSLNCRGKDLRIHTFYNIEVRKVER